MKPLSIAVAVLVVLGSFAGWTGGTPAAAQQLSVAVTGPQWDAFVASVRERVREAQASVPPGEDDLPLVDTTSPPPSAGSAIVTLARTVASMAESLVPDLVPRASRELGDGWIYQVVLSLPPDLHLRGGSEFETLGLRAIDEANDVTRNLTQVAPDFPAAMKQLSLCVTHLALARQQASDDDQRAFADASLLGITRVGELLARESLERARSAGIDPRVIGDADATLAEGLAAAADGRYSDALSAYSVAVDPSLIPMVDIARFGQNLHERFQNATVGYQFAIASNGRVVTSGEGGFARTPVDGMVEQSANKEMNIASVSKTLTAMTVVQILFEKGISVDAPVGPYLPDSWDRGPGIDTLTFADLLTHRSGLDGNRNRGVSFAELRSYIAAGVDPADKAVYTYQNANFTIFRIIIPFLHYGPAVMNGLGTSMDLDWPTAVLYRDLVRDRVLSRAGVQGECGYPTEDSQPATLSYAYPASAFPGGFGLSWAGASGFLACSSGGWLFSSREMATILARRRHTNLILSPAERTAMDERFLGWQPRPGILGTYRSHGGLLYTDVPARGLTACWMELPNGVEASALVNSFFNGALHYACDMLLDAFDHALVAAPEKPWITPPGGGGI